MKHIHYSDILFTVVCMAYVDTNKNVLNDDGDEIGNIVHHCN